MKKLMRKAITVLGSIAMVGATIGTAAAAAYPTPFEDGAYAVVYGASDDLAAATTVANGLPALDTGTTIVEGGDSYMFEKASESLNIGEELDNIDSSLNEDDLLTLLAEGEYTDTNNDDFDTSQEVTIADGLKVELFEDSDYARDEPTLGIVIDDGDPILNYTLTFDDQPDIADMESTDLVFMGKEYFVLSAPTTNDELELLDAAADTIVAEGETKTITAGDKTYTVSIEFVDLDSAKLNVNGEVTNDIEAGQTYKLDDDSYIGMKEILYNAKDTGISKVEFSIGSGKLVIKDGQTVELNDDDIDGVTGYIVNSSGQLDEIILVWEADDDLFITEDSSITMPGFETFMLSITDIDFPEEETITFENDGDQSFKLSNFPMKGSTNDINIVTFDSITGNFTYIGDTDADQQLSLDGSFDETTDEYALVTYERTDEAESYLIRATSWDDTSGDEEVTIQYKKDGSWTDAKTIDEAGDDLSIGSLDLTVDFVNFTSEFINFTGTYLATDILYSVEGLKIDLSPLSSLNENSTEVKLLVWEENDDGDLGSVNGVNVTIGTNADNEVEVNSVTVLGSSGSDEIGDTDEFQSYVESELATEVLFDSSPDQETLRLVYHSEEVIVSAYLTSSSATTSTGSGTKTFMDTEAESYTGKNIVVVGGSCVNSIAATLLGSACGDSFTGATGVGPGQFLIESFDYSGKIATVVAGYEKDDTAHAATYLANEANAVSTEVGAKYMGTSATEASLVVV